MTRKNRWLAIALFPLFSPLFSLTAAGNPERDSARIAGSLRAYSDQEWAKIAGERGAEKYEILKGDTLWGISGRLFGDEKVWPKIWEINNQGILNPHMIEPRTSLVFNAGSGLNLPSLAIANAGISTVKSHYRIDPDDRPGPLWDERTPMPSGEWKRLPRQSWENVQVDLPADIDKDGFDTKNRIYLRKPATGLELPAWIACSPLSPVGRVEGARTDSTNSHGGQELTIRAVGQPLEIGAVYSVLDANPMKIQSGEREAFSYEVQGKVKILGVQSGIYVGEILRAQSLLERGALLVPEVKRVGKTAPRAGASQVKGSIIADRRSGSFMSGQNKWVYIDRGARDGVERGMIFRIFQNQDPRTSKPLTPGEVFVQGDAQIVQGCDTFSIGMFVWSRGEVPERYPGILLTDIADEKIRFYFNGEAAEVEMTEKPIEPAPSVTVDAPAPIAPEAAIGPGPGDPDVLTPSIEPRMEGGLEKAEGDGEDWLDRLDNGQDLKSEEEAELLQLEKFQEKSTAEAPATDGADLPPPPSDELPAPPAAESADLPPAPPESEFASDDPVQEVPAAPGAPPPTDTATAPKAPPAGEDSLEDLTPL